MAGAPKSASRQEKALAEIAGSRRRRPYAQSKPSRAGPALQSARSTHRRDVLGLNAGRSSTNEARLLTFDVEAPAS